MDNNLTSNINEATHWLAKDDKNNDCSGVTVGKAYPLVWDESEQEYHIVDDKGICSLIYLVHKGDFVILDSQAKNKYAFKGYAWTELAECWGITVGYEYFNIYGEDGVLDDDLMESMKSPEGIEITKYINGMKMVFTTKDEEEVLAEKIRRYIFSNIDKETGRFRDNQIREDMNEFLIALIDQSKKYDYCYPIYEGLLAVNNDDTFARWFCNNLEGLWS